MDPLSLSVLVSAEKKFWRWVQSGEVPHLIMAEPPRPRIEAIRYERIEFLGRLRGALPQHPGSLSRPRARQERAQGVDAGGRQGGDRARGTCQTVESGGGELRRPDHGGHPCPGPVNQWRRSPRPWPRRKPNSSTRKSH